MAARKTSELPTRIWKFACEIEPGTMPAAMNILYRSSRYYNKLVEIERARHERFVKIRRKHAPELAAMEDRWQALDVFPVSLRPFVVEASRLGVEGSRLFASLRR